MRKMKGSVTIFAMLMLGMIIGMYLMGFASPIIYFVQQNVIDVDQATVEDGEIQPETVKQVGAEEILSLIIEKIVSLEGMAFMGLSLAGAVLVGFAGAGYVGQSILNITIPAFLLYLIANIFFFPVLDYDIATKAPAEINILLVIIFNTLLGLTIISFIMGRD